MKQVGIPKIIYSAFSIDFALTSIKNYLSLNKNDKLIREFIDYDRDIDEIKIKFPAVKVNNSNKNKILISNLSNTNLEKSAENINFNLLKNISYLETLINSNDSINNNNNIENSLEKERDFITVKDTKVKINIRSLFQSLSDDDLVDLTTFKMKLKIKNVIKTESGKWPSLLGNTIAFDSKNAVEYINFNLAEKLKFLIKKNLNIDVALDTLLTNLNKTNTLKINEYTPFVNILLKEKFEIYKNDENNQRRKFAKITDNISKKLGLQYPVISQIPLYTGFKIFNIVKIFLKNIFNSIIFFLWILSFMLVYSLILSNVDEKNYEFGMLRSLGFKKSNLISVIIFQSLMFSIPAILISLLLASLANIPVMLFFFYFAGIETNLFLSKPTIVLGILAGLTLPLVSSYFPVKKALSANLKDSLSIFNKKISDVSVSIVKLEKMGISPSLFLTSLILIILGFLTYYVAPLSFLNMDFSTFLFILNAILIMMIIGLILLMQIFVPKIQKWILNILMLLCRKDKNLKFVIEKNLDGHFSRNQKSSIMFMIALSFVIFAGCTILLICNFIVSASKNVFGSDIWVGQLDDNDSLDEKELVRYLLDFESKFPYSIRNYTFISMDMRDFLQTDIRLSTLNGIFILIFN
jgi:ABC-type antimicrobial peptide transport system permease subunit